MNSIQDFWDILLEQFEKSKFRVYIQPLDKTR